MDFVLSHSVVLTLCDPIDCSPPSSCPWNFPGKNTGMSCHFFSSYPFYNNVIHECPTLVLFMVGNVYKLILDK